MSRIWPSHPAEEYVLGYLTATAFAGESHVRVRPSTALPVVQTLAAPAFGRFRSGLRHLCKLEPEPPYRPTRSGVIEFCVDRQIDGQWFMVFYRFNCVFGSDGGDPYVEIRIEQTGSMPGPDPASCLY